MDENIPVEERIFVLSKVFQSVPMYFAHWEDALIQPEELDDTFKVFIPRVLGAETRIEFSKIMYELFGLLNNGHTSFHDGHLVKGSPRLGFSVNWIDRRWIVTGSQINSLHPGDEIISLNRIPLETLYRDSEKYLRRGSDRSTRMAFGSGAWSVFGFPINYYIEWEDGEGEHHSESVDRQGLPTTWQSNSISHTEGRWIAPNDSAYIRIPSFGDSKYENAALEYVFEYKDARVLIVDVRDNRGGNTPVKLRKALIDRPFRAGSMSSPHKIGVQQVWAGWGQTHLMWPSHVVQPEDCVFHGKLYVLANRGTGSAAEDFVSSIKASARGTIVGEATFGSTGQPVFFDCGNEMSFRISTIRCYNPDGSKFEGSGIPPDIIVEPARNDIYDGRDRILERVLAEVLS